MVILKYLFCGVQKAACLNVHQFQAVLFFLLQYLCSLPVDFCLCVTLPVCSLRDSPGCLLHLWKHTYSIKAVTVRLLLKLIQTCWHTLYNIQLNVTPDCNCPNFKGKNSLQAVWPLFVHQLCFCVWECVSVFRFCISTISTPLPRPGVRGRLTFYIPKPFSPLLLNFRLWPKTLSFSPHLTLSLILPLNHSSHFHLPNNIVVNFTSLMYPWVWWCVPGGKVSSAHASPLTDRAGCKDIHWTKKEGVG